MTDETRAQREDRIQENVQAKKAAASNDTGKTVWMYVGYAESGEWDTFSDELEAHRYAIKGASKVRVEKRELKKRAK